MSTEVKRIDVAVGVIHYKDKYLLGFRSAQQHQGNRYEFIGGKIEPNEKPKNALVREIYEEIGLAINNSNIINPLGMLIHNYEDKMSDSKTIKQVCLHVFRVAVSQEQYQLLLSKNIGFEQQPLTWVGLTDLLANEYQLPDANKTILEWLRVPDQIVITYDTSSVPVFKKSTIIESSNKFFESKSIFSRSGLEQSKTQKNEQLLSNWLEFHIQKLPKNSWVYLRLKNLDLKEQAKAILNLIAKRPDLSLILNIKIIEAFNESNDKLLKQIVAQHLTQSQLEAIKFDEGYHESGYDIDYLLPELPIIISCHDEQSIGHVNKLAKYRISNNLAPVMSIFISPVCHTKTHPDNPPLGYEKFSRLALQSQTPVIGLGGLNPNDLKNIRNYGGDKVSGIREFMIQDESS